MRIGISPFASSRESTMHLAGSAVEGGLDTLWLGDGYLATPDFPEWSGGLESIAELAFLAGRFPAARVGITAAVLPIRDVVWTAKQANTMARLAGGGFVLVVTPGYWRRDLEARGQDYDRRGQTFDTRLDELLAALADPGFSPGPPTEPVPVWLAGAAATMGRAIERKLPFQSSRSGPDDLAPIASEFFDRGGTELAHRVRVEIGGHGVAGNAVDWHAVIGSVDHVVAALGHFRELGVSDLSIIPGQDEDTSRRTIEALITEVVPQLG